VRLPLPELADQAMSLPAWPGGANTQAAKMASRPVMEPLPPRNARSRFAIAGELRVPATTACRNLTRRSCCRCGGGRVSLLWCCRAAVGPFFLVTDQSSCSVVRVACLDRSGKRPRLHRKCSRRSAEERVPVDARPELRNPSHHPQPTVMLGQPGIRCRPRSLDSRHHRPPTTHLIRLVDDLLTSRVSRSARFASRRKPSICRPSCAVRRGRSTAARSLNHEFDLDLPEHPFCERRQGTARACSSIC